MKNLLLIALVLFGTTTTTFASDSDTPTLGENATECKNAVQGNRNATDKSTVSDSSTQAEDQGVSAE